MDRGGAELCLRPCRSDDAPAARAHEHHRGVTRPGALRPHPSLLHRQSPAHPAIVDTAAPAIRSGTGFRGAAAIRQDLWREDPDLACESILTGSLPEAISA